MACLLLTFSRKWSFQGFGNFGSRGLLGFGVQEELRHGVTVVIEMGYN